MVMTTEQLSKILNSAIRSGTEKTLIHSGLIRDLVCKKKAYARFGRTNVDRWISEGLIVPVCGKNSAQKS